MSYAFPTPPTGSATPAGPPRVAETRQQPRLRIPAAYSVVRVREAIDPGAGEDPAQAPDAP